MQLDYTNNVTGVIAGVLKSLITLTLGQDCINIHRDRLGAGAGNFSLNRNIGSRITRVQKVF